MTHPAMPCLANMAYEFSEGLAAVELNKRKGYVNPRGEVVVEPSFLAADKFSGGLACVDIGTGLAHASIAEACEKGFINQQGDFEIPPRFFAAASFNHGLCLVETEKKIGYINRKGQFIWTSGWMELGSFDPHRILPPEEEH